MRERVFILPGRHQPPHNDHVALLRRALETIAPNPLYLALIIADPRPAPNLVSATEHHAAERNPYSYAERVELVHAALSAETATIRERIHLLALPRPELYWPLVTEIFPEPRIWLVPDTGENFDDLKASFFRAQGDEVLRIPLPPTTDGRLVRDLAKSNSPELAHHVPRAVFELLHRKTSRR